MSHEPTMQDAVMNAAPAGKKLRIAMIGAGNIANTHIGAYAKIPQAEVVAVCDIDAARLKITCDRHGIQNRYTDVAAMLADKDKLGIEAADVCVWNCNHASCAIAALNAGLHVICEKPMAYNTEQAIEMKAAAERAGKLLMIGFVMRFMDESKVAMDFVESGALGQVYYAKATYLRRHGCPGGWFSDKSRSGGGPVIDLGVHVIDNARVMMGSPMPVSVYAATSSLLGNRKHLKTGVGWHPLGASDKDLCDVEDFGTALIRYDNGAVMLLETSYSLNGDGITKREVFGDKGGIRCDSQGIRLYSEMNGYMVNVTPDISNLKEGKDGFQAELEHFIDCVQNGTPCRATADDGIIVMKILDAIYESARTGHEVKIK